MGLIRIPDIPGAEGETSVNANPGPGVTDYRAEHDPPHVHLGSNDGPRVSTKDFRPLSDKDAMKMTDKQRKFCSSLSDEAKDLIRQRQQQIFKYGRISPVKPNGFISPVVVEEMTPWGFFYGLFFIVVRFTDVQRLESCMEILIGMPVSAFRSPITKARPFRWLMRRAAVRAPGYC
jgi:hypothetical protein